MLMCRVVAEELLVVGPVRRDRCEKMRSGDETDLRTVMP